MDTGYLSLFVPNRLVPLELRQFRWWLSVSWTIRRASQGWHISAEAHRFDFNDALSVLPGMHFANRASPAFASCESRSQKTPGSVRRHRTHMHLLLICIHIVYVYVYMIIYVCRSVDNLYCQPGHVARGQCHRCDARCHLWAQHPGCGSLWAATRLQ